ncbi:phosphate ABC transporter permease PstA [Ruania alkalisoli]|uniref:Phosphate transport system permease protein PstA n=1 Tax=Ruania alkalisoli TaxID=2779775 RepID=A0A7M1SRG3_9MICO|nr:phosphate ABC transporter permease PstA [Ruania alkalisoli]QOR70169.1 phosphate ABC transporter permease PstA [Ruania alkalisoli]
MSVAAPPVPTRTYRRLPAWAPYAVLVVSLAVTAGVLTSLGALTIASMFFVSAIVYAVAITVTSTVVEGRRWATDRLATTLVTFAFLLAVIPLISLLWIVIGDGVERFGPTFLTTDMVGIFGSMVEGGVAHAIVGTVYVTGIAGLISVPLGIFTAIYLVEYGSGPVKRGITLLVDVMTGIPSIVAGLFAYTMFLVIFGPAYKSALIGGIALAVLMTPYVIRSVEEMLKLVPNELREASFALGVPKWLTIVKVVLRTAVAGITSGVMIATARVIGETAPLLVTVGTIQAMNWNPFDGRIETLPVYVFRQYAQGGPAADRAWAAALTLLLIVMLLNLIGRLVSKFFSPKGGR